MHTYINKVNLFNKIKKEYRQYRGDIDIVNTIQ